MGHSDAPKVSCQTCRKTALLGNEEPACISDKCPIGFDLLPDSALRILEIRGLLISLHELHLADKICAEFDADLDDLRLLAEIETLLKEINPPPKGQDNG